MRINLRGWLLLLAMTAGAVLVHGYHLGAEDAEIYLPAVKQRLNPALYPYGGEFFLSHARLSVFSQVIAGSIRATHVSFEGAVFAWHVLSIFLLLLACRSLAEHCFRSAPGRWAGTGLVAALLTLPVAGTALYIMDQYLTARSLVTPAVMFGVLYTVERKYMRAALCLLFGALVHPLMAVFGASYAVLAAIVRRAGERKETVQGAAALAAFLPLGISLGAPSPAYREVLTTRSYFFLQKWAWYEWLGAIAPIGIFWWLAGLARKKELRVTELVCRTAAFFGAIYLAGAMVFTMPERFEGLAKLQPMRALHLEYILMLVVGGGVLGEFVLKAKAWRWMVVFLPLCAGMWYSAHELFPASPRVEWPGAAAGNAWVQAFRWIRDNTPADAVFALDPHYMELAGEDQHGFRLLAERSRLADAVKDSGVVTMFPALAEGWKAQVEAQSPWEKLTREDFLRLRHDYNVRWVVLQQPDRKGLVCPYENQAVLVCRVE